MHPVEPPLQGREISADDSGDGQLVCLRLYVARSTPNSVRAQHNLTAVLDTLKNQWILPRLEIIDVFLQPRRAVTDGVIVTPTLIGLGVGKRVVLMGDLADRIQLEGVLLSLLKG